MGSAAFICDTPNQYGKFGPHGKRCIIKRYLVESKGYVLLGEHTKLPKLNPKTHILKMFI